MAKKPKERITHFATEDITACGESLVFESSELVFYSKKDADYYGIDNEWEIDEENCLHSTDPDFVTCKECKITRDFKKALKESQANKENCEKPIETKESEF
jgi:hypothetical protein